jgi:hypothetical protein
MRMFNLLNLLPDFDAVWSRRCTLQKLVELKFGSIEHVKYIKFKSSFK